MAKKREQDICSRGGCSSIDLWIMCVCEETFSSTQGVVASSIEVVMKMKEGGVTKKTFSKYWNVTPNLSTFGLLFIMKIERSSAKKKDGDEWLEI